MLNSVEKGGTFERAIKKSFLTNDKKYENFYNKNEYAIKKYT